MDYRLTDFAVWLDDHALAPGTRRVYVHVVRAILRRLDARGTPLLPDDTGTVASLDAVQAATAEVATTGTIGIAGTAWRQFAAWAAEACGIAVPAPARTRKRALPPSAAAAIWAVYSRNVGLHRLSAPIFARLRWDVVTVTPHGASADVGEYKCAWGEDALPAWRCLETYRRGDYVCADEYGDPMSEWYVSRTLRLTRHRLRHDVAFRAAVRDVLPPRDDVLASMLAAEWTSTPAPPEPVLTRPVPPPACASAPKSAPASAPARAPARAPEAEAEAVVETAAPPPPPPPSSPSPPAPSPPARMDDAARLAAIAQAKRDEVAKAKAKAEADAEAEAEGIDPPIPRVRCAVCGGAVYLRADFTESCAEGHAGRSIDSP